MVLCVMALQPMQAHVGALYNLSILYDIYGIPIPLTLSALPCAPLIFALKSPRDADWVPI
jgi:hypothetical protein